MTVPVIVLILAAVCLGALPPTQAGINSTLARHLGHPLLGALTNTAVATLVLIVAVTFARVPFADLRGLIHAPPWNLLGGLLGATMVLGAIIIAPRLGAAGFVTAMTVGTVCASIAIDHFGLIGFTVHPVSFLRLVGGGLVVFGMILVQSN